jgi:DNA-binding GntR family transcriptional regulator
VESSVSAIGPHGGGHGIQGTLTVLEEIRTDVLNGVFSPREHLVEADLADRYAAPRAAVREALIALTAEGLIDRRPHRGARVRSLSIEEAIEIAETRVELEALCARHAATAATAEERAGLLARIGTMRLSVAAADHAAYREASIALHEAIAAAARQATARRLLGEIRNHNLHRHFPQAFPQGGTGASLPDHEDIVIAIVAGDPAAAEQAMRSHVARVAGFLHAHRGRLASVDALPVAN